MQTEQFSTHNHPTVQVLRLKQVCARTALCRAMIYPLVALGDFPDRIQLGCRAVGWLQSDVETWLRTRSRLRQSARI